MHRKIFLALAAVLCSVPVFALDLVDLSQPESVTVDPKTGDIFVSSVNGSVFDRDPNGYVSKISSDGLVVVLKFIESKPGVYELHAPKGLVVYKNALYVVDLDSVKAFSLENGSLIHSVDLAPIGAKFPNDIASAPDGSLYVSDMLANRIYRIVPEAEYKLSVYREGEDLGQPNGLLFDRFTKNLMVATFQTGELLELDKKGGVRRLRTGLEGLDGLTSDGAGNIYVSSYAKGEIYKISKWGRGPLTLFQTGLKKPADIFYDPVHRLLQVPLMGSNSVTSYPVEDRRARRPQASSLKTGRAGS